MKQLSVIHFAKIGLTVLFALVLNVSLAKADVHTGVVGDADIGKIASAADSATPDHTDRQQDEGGGDSTSHHFGDCHVHLIVAKKIRMDGIASPKAHAWSQSDDLMMLSLLQGLYRPPRS